MRGTTVLFGILILISASLIAYNIYLYGEIQSLKAISNNRPTLTSNEVVSLVDQRLKTLEKRKAQQLLSSLEAQYQLASTTTPGNRLLYGESNARITLQEFADIECPYCRKMHAGIKQVVEHSQGVINWEFKHFPLSGHNPVAAIESQAVECVREAYDNRIAWIALERLMADTRGNGKGVGDIDQYVRSFGLNGILIGNCLASDAHKGKINQNYDEGRNLGISATPAIRILDNQTGKEYLLKGFKTSEQLLQAIQQILSQH